MTEIAQTDAPSLPGQSQLTSQLEKEQDVENAGDKHVSPLDPPPKNRPRSALELKPSLSPSPAFLEPTKLSKDDTCVSPSPVTPRRPNILSRGLSLQMPTKNTSGSNTAPPASRLPISPKFDSSPSYNSTASVLPRRSRGMDFSRACTNLHHSTLAEQSSPDSSPIIGGRSMAIPSRRGMYSNSNASSVPDSPGCQPASVWSSTSNVDRTGVSSSVGSVNMMDSNSSSSSSDDDMGHDGEGDTTQMPSQAFAPGNKSGNPLMINPFATGPISNHVSDSTSPFSPSAPNFMSFQRARWKQGSKRKSSSSASGQSSMQSPGPVSPPLLKSIESSLSGYFSRDLARKDIESRRQSLSLGTHDLHLSDAADSDEGESSRTSPGDVVNVPVPLTPSLDDRKSVIRRAVTRRSNLLPKPKSLARMKTVLLEEDSPVDTEVRREAEVIRQVRESDNSIDLSLKSTRVDAVSSPNMLAIGTHADLAEIGEDDIMSHELSEDRRPSNTFTQQALRNSSGATFWNTFDERMRTPPPSMFPRSSSSGISDDASVDTRLSSVLSTTPQQHSMKANQNSPPRSSTPQPLASAAEVTRKMTKRRRDDDLDPNCFKRRAVSPGVSVQNSPILPSSPAQKDGYWWGIQSKSNRETPSGHVAGERMNGAVNIFANGSGPPKRVGLQGMTDTHDGLMNMSIE